MYLLSLSIVLVVATFSSNTPYRSFDESRYARPLMENPKLPRRSLAGDGFPMGEITQTCCCAGRMRGFDNQTCYD